MSGCGLTETITKTETRAVIPPAYMYKTSPVPKPEKGVDVADRTDATLNAYGDRGVVIDKANARAEALQEWAETATRVYENSAERSLEQLRKLEQGSE